MALQLPRRKMSPGASSTCAAETLRFIGYGMGMEGSRVGFWLRDLSPRSAMALLQQLNLGRIQTVVSRCAFHTCFFTATSSGIHRVYTLHLK